MWARIGNTALGIWLMAAPSVLGYDGRAMDNDHIVGPIAATFAVVAIWETTRGLRWVNLLLGIWLLIAPFALGYDETRALVNSLIVGAAMIVLSQLQGTIKQEFGGGWRALLHSHQTEHSPGTNARQQ